MNTVRLLDVGAQQVALLLVVLLFYGFPAVAEQLSDPTRPAFDLIPGLSDGAVTQAAPPQGLQSVIISHGREAAIINGIEIVRGEKFGEEVLTTVNETCVVLEGPEGRRVMQMFPAVSMTKNQQACAKRLTFQPISKTARKPVKKAKTKSAVKPKSRVKAKKSAVVCVPLEEYEKYKNRGEK